ncbi:MAG TPA: DUF6644 family protein, partial [Alphaproteobacteria bacterium]|nr:DUF6644 family protein [Alphaproteobacteria bacterium]
QSLSSVSERLIPWVWRALIVLLFTGLVLITGEPGRSLVNSIFQVKMALVIVAIALTLFLQRSLRAKGAADVGAGAKAIAALSLVTWVLIVFAGRWIAYGDTLFGGGS